MAAAPRIHLRSAAEDGGLSLGYETFQSKLMFF